MRMRLDVPTVAIVGLVILLTDHIEATPCRTGASSPQSLPERAISPTSSVTSSTSSSGHNSQAGFSGLQPRIGSTPIVALADDSTRTSITTRNSLSPRLEPSSSPSMHDVSSSSDDTTPVLPALTDKSALPIYNFTFFNASAETSTTSRPTKSSLKLNGTSVSVLSVATAFRSGPSSASFANLVNDRFTLTISSTKRNLAATPVPPKPLTTPSTRPAAKVPSNMTSSCGPVSQFYHSNAVNWTQAGVGPWFDGWWEQNKQSFQAEGGFAGTFGSTYLGNPNWRCKDDGSSDCDFDPCNQPVLNSAQADIQPAYMVLQSTQNLHSYFQGLSEAFQVSAIFASLSKDDWAFKFYRDKRDFSKTSLKEVVNAITSAVGVIAAFAAPFGSIVKIAASAANTLFTAGVNGAKYMLESRPTNDTPVKSAAMGADMAQAFIQSIMHLITANDKLMAGENYLDTGDIRKYFANGAFLDFQGIDKTVVIEKARDMLASIALNFLWKQQKIFILGGGSCDDLDGIGTGPREAKLCIDNKAWYLFFWKEYGGIHWFSKKQWGNVDAPPGFDELGKGDFANITIQAIIASSVASNKAAGLNYTSDMFLQKTQQKLSDGTLKPSDAGPHWEGMFSIPVCDVSGVIKETPKVFPKKSAVLQPWGGGKIPTWCKPICTNASGQLDHDLTISFLEFAQMKNFESPTTYCSNYYSWNPWGEGKRDWNA